MRKIKHLLFPVVVAVSFSAFAQQTPQFAQFVFNEFGTNPAFTGSTKCLEVIIGRREQWTGWDNAPKTSFIGVSKDFTKNKRGKYWHGVGLYAEQDKNEIEKYEGIYPSYAIHLKVLREYVATFGIFAGIRVHSVGTILNAPGDPVLNNLPQNVLVYPEITPGIRIASKEAFYGLSVKQLYKSKIQAHGKQIGGPSRLTPHFYFVAGKKIESQSYYYTYLPAIQIKYGVALPPTIDFNFMMFVKDKIGFGMSYRFHDALIGMVSAKFHDGQLRVGLAYEYSISKIRYAGANAQEFIMGFSPCSDGFGGNTNCPTFDF